MIVAIKLLYVCINILYDLFCFVRLRSNNIDCCSQGMLLSITSQFSSYLKVFFFFSFKYALVITLALKLNVLFTINLF